jgi:basic membrane protein A and related proteins
MRKAITRRAPFAVIAVGALLLAACGDDDDDDAAAPVTTAATDSATTAPVAESSATAAESATAAGEPIKAAWIYVGPINDGGWTTAHDNGRKYVEEQLGDAVETTYKENVPEGPEVAQVIDDLVADGNDIIFATSFGFGEAMQAASVEYPDVAFEWATGIAPTDNMGIYYGAGEQANYLAGMSAGAATESNIIGFVAPFPIPEVIRHIDAYALGAQSVNPDAVVKVVWVNSWFDPTNERQAADSLISAGADVIASGGDSPAPGEAAKAAGVAWTGYDSDQSTNFPDEWLTAAVYNWGPYYAQQVQAAMDGTWAPGEYYGNIADGFVDIAPFGSRVTQETQDMITAKRQEIVDGKFDIFAGPITDQAGTVRVAAGESLSFGDQMTIDWFVAGVDGDPTGG